MSQNGTYATYDLSESLDRVSMDGNGVPVEAIRAWGRSPEGGGSWEGGFLLRLSTEKYAYITGWADYTGWGCQDGALVAFSDVPEIDFTAVSAKFCFDVPSISEWDESPADLNMWISNGMRSADAL